VSRYFPDDASRDLIEAASAAGARDDDTAVIVDARAKKT
jgi:hypothetical protein